MKLPAFRHWNSWLLFGFVRLFVFWMSALFWFGFIYWLFPEARLPQFLPDQFEAIWFAALLVGDTVLFGYLVTAIGGIIANCRLKLT